MDSASAVIGCAARRERLRELMERRGVGALLLRRPANFAWYTGGAARHVDDRVAPDGVADLIVDADGDWVLNRMREEATAPGWTLAEAFGYGKRFSADVGFPDEWQLHHQGGLTGYASRELIATPTCEHVIEAGPAFAWNPSIAGAKAEEPWC